MINSIIIIQIQNTTYKLIRMIKSLVYEPKMSNISTEQQQANIAYNDDDDTDIGLMDLTKKKHTESRKVINLIYDDNTTENTPKPRSLLDETSNNDRITDFNQHEIESDQLSSNILCNYHINSLAISESIDLCLDTDNHSKAERIINTNDINNNNLNTNWQQTRKRKLSDSHSIPYKKKKR